MRINSIRVPFAANFQISKNAAAGLKKDNIDPSNIADSFEKRTEDLPGTVVLEKYDVNDGNRHLEMDYFQKDTVKKGDKPSAIYVVKSQNSNAFSDEFFSSIVISRD